MLPVIMVQSHWKIDGVSLDKRVLILVSVPYVKCTKSTGLRTGIETIQRSDLVG